MRNAHEAHVMGPPARHTDPVEALPFEQDQSHVRHRIFAGGLEGEIVAHALLMGFTDPVANGGAWKKALA